MSSRLMPARVTTGASMGLPALTMRPRVSSARVMTGCHFALEPVHIRLSAKPAPRVRAINLKHEAALVDLLTRLD
jgi:hypothetical protein